jgi:serine/threonine-protein kinase HipA
MAKELRVLISEEEVGSLHLERGRVRIEYDNPWRLSATGFPLSLSMPLSGREYAGSVVENYLWNLLPDREETVVALARRYAVSPRNPFALIGAHGQDLPGAVQIAPPELVQDVTAREGVKLISEAKLAAFLKRLTVDPSLNRIDADTSHFSLAGAQPKKAILRVGEKWYEHRGRTPTTHILKPPMRDLDASVENEHFCLKLAAELGLRTAKANVVRIGGEPTICVERYDRVRIKGTGRVPLEEAGGKVYRIHQEDFCQATGHHPQVKYQNLGGPGVADIMRILAGSADARVDRDRFMRALVFNFIILGIDAHAKNFSILIDHDGFRLAPLYDIISAAAYDTRRFGKLAMSVGGEYSWRRIAGRHWDKTAEACGYPADALRAHRTELAQRIPTACKTVLADCRASGLTSPLLEALATAIAKRSAEVGQEYELA